MFVERATVWKTNHRLLWEWLPVIPHWAAAASHQDRVVLRLRVPKAYIIEGSVKTTPVSPRLTDQHGGSGLLLPSEVKYQEFCGNATPSPSTRCYSAS
ncbi:hypothetical protein C8J57DRAFT_1289061 [Mycena rebaudengoi]|nr:hypothetical protein C8J57DRAFT_1289061 [Mycena rebaudengoi]